MQPKPPQRQQSRIRLHLGCGPVHLPGWINVDRQRTPAVQVVTDLASGLPFARADAIFAEHFIEHLDLMSALRLLRCCREILAEDGVLRLSTPNLDWVWATSYSSRWRALRTRREAALIVPDTWSSAEPALLDALRLNRAFYGWGHRFVYNAPMLEAILRKAGFARVRFYAYGESEVEELRNLERHPRDPNLGSISHVLIAEASGRGDPEQVAWPSGTVAEFLDDTSIR